MTSFPYSLYLIIDPDLCTADPIVTAKTGIRNGADIIQLRYKGDDINFFHRLAGRLRLLTQRLNVPLIINDRVDICESVGAEGVPLGQDDFPITLARKLMGEDVIIGGSAVSLKDAQRCFTEGSDYVGFGPVYPTSSKPDASSPTGIEIMKKAIEAVPLPVIAIGGIHAQNVPEVMHTGAYGIAVISAVCCQTDPKQATRKLSRAMRMEK